MNVSYSFVANSNPPGAGSSESNEQKANNNSQEGRDNLDLLLEIAEAFNVLLPPKNNSDQVPSPSAHPPPTKPNATMHAANNPEDFFHLANSAWLSERSDDPINEFTDMHDLLVGAFPQIFLFGTSYKAKNSLPTPHELEHLLLQYTNTPATSPGSCFFIYLTANLATRFCRIYQPE